VFDESPAGAVLELRYASSNGVLFDQAQGLSRLLPEQKSMSYWTAMSIDSAGTTGRCSSDLDVPTSDPGVRNTLRCASHPGGRGTSIVESGTVPADREDFT
jgi:hypothetical protein